MTTFIAISEDVFGGYGLIAMGETKNQAIANLYAEYRKQSAGWNEGGEIYCKTLGAFRDHWGWNIIELTPDQPATALCG